MNEDFELLLYGGRGNGAEYPRGEKNGGCSFHVQEYTNY